MFSITYALNAQDAQTECLSPSCNDKEQNFLLQVQFNTQSAALLFTTLLKTDELGISSFHLRF